MVTFSILGAPSQYSGFDLNTTSCLEYVTGIKGYDMAVIPNHGKGEADPYPYLFMFYHSKASYPIMENETFDRLYFQSMATVDPDKRKVIYGQMQEVIMDECVAAFLLHPGKVGIAKKELNDFELKHGFGGFEPFKRAYWNEGN